ncbi:hypothetical protein [Streptomyces sp. NPDC059862]|uniref:hypothetical protein n=1 Tax=unclassified Streptomyces TaxID=2593676 RepID=UPI0036408773
MDQAEVLLIGGRAGVGKTTVGWGHRLCRAQAQLLKKLPIPRTSWVANVHVS